MAIEKRNSKKFIVLGVIGIIVLFGWAGLWLRNNDYHYKQMNQGYLEESNHVELLHISMALNFIEKNNPKGNLLCGGNEGYCEGDTRNPQDYRDVQKSNGLGWIKANLQRDASAFDITFIPDGNYKKYTYCSDGKQWEIEIEYEDPWRFERFMSSDMGDKKDRFELGSNVTLCK